MAARESQHYVVDFFSADSRGEVLERESPPFQQALKPPPPVALSLRTRESSALALKHIFDQIYSSAESNPNNNNNINFRAHDKISSDFQAFNRDASNAAPFQVGRNHAIPPGWQVNSFPEEHRSCAPETETSFNKVQSQGFSLHDLAHGAPTMALPLSQTCHLSLQQTSLPHAVARTSTASTSVRQPTAQLTIFYSGTVNVYDDVPADKANAIMLLAGTGNSLYVKQSSEGNKDYSSAALKSPSPPPLHMGPAATGMGGTTGASAASASSGKAMGFSVPPASNLINTLTTTIPPNPLPAPSLTMEPKPQAAPKRPHSGIELPHARKASLARFLEKRKDRVQVKHQQTEATSQYEEKVETSKEERPPSPKKPYMAGLSSPTSKQ